MVITLWLYEGFVFTSWLYESQWVSGVCLVVKWVKMSEWCFILWLYESQSLIGDNLVVIWVTMSDWCFTLWLCEWLVFYLVVLWVIGVLPSGYTSDWFLPFGYISDWCFTLWLYESATITVSLSSAVFLTVTPRGCCSLASIPLPSTSPNANRF